MKKELPVTEPGLRLDLYLARQLTGYSRSHLQGLIERGLVKVGGAVKPAAYRLEAADIIEIDWPSADWKDAPLKDWILFEDKDVLVIDKPPFLLMHPLGESWLSTPEAALNEPEANLAGILFHQRPDIAASGAERCGIVHRLDRETSGVLIVAKNPEAQKTLIASFADRTVSKTYRAVVLGKLDEAIEVDAPIGRRPDHRKIEVTKWGKDATTRLTPLKSSVKASLIEASPKTGRTHQIRAHLAYVKHPVIGDIEWTADWKSLAAKKGLPPVPRLLLHAYKLDIEHPSTGKRREFSADLPKDMRDYWAAASAAKGGGESRISRPRTGPAARRKR